MLMCYHLSLVQNLNYLQKRFGAEFEDDGSYEPSYHMAAFSSPQHAVITGEAPLRIRLLEWGLIPRWVRSEEQASDVRRGTFNAKAETVLRKPSFRSSIMDRRCLVLADGFFEWRQAGGKKYPYYIRLKGADAFAIAGIWDEWKSGGGARRTFSLLTTEANPMMARIHNTKKRMPAMLRREDERRWLEKGLGADDIRSMLRPYDDKEMEAWTVSRLITSKGNKNVPAVIAPFIYRELEAVQERLF
jgi:putative SOS response-associated peptidase YedK